MKSCPFCGSDPERWEYQEATGKFRISVMCSNEECPVDIEVEGIYREYDNDGLTKEELWASLESRWDTRYGH